MIMKLKDLPRNFMGVYKINYPNGKCYIGISVDIKRRIWEHNNYSKAKMPCDLAIKSFGLILDEIEILEQVQYSGELEDREKYWIQYYHSNNPLYGYNLTEGGDGSGRSNDKNCRSVFSNDQVLDIRRRRFNGERKKDVYMDYQSYSFSTFEKIWLGLHYPDIGREFIIPTNSISRQEYSAQANQGLNNGRAKASKEDIIKIRKLYEQEHKSFSEINKLFPQYSRNTVSRIAKRETFKNVE